MLRIAVCDDDIRICSYVEETAIKYSEAICEIFETDTYYTGEKLLVSFSEGEYYDVIFLDIELGYLSGVDIGHRIRKDYGNQSTQIVYISSYKKYMAELFSVRPMNFFLKPLKENWIFEALETAMELVQQGDVSFSFKIGRRHHKVLIKDILYFHIEHRVVEVVTVNGCMTYYDSLTNLCNKFKQYFFVNTNRSYLVNYKHIISFDYKSLTLTNYEELPISKGKFAELEKLQKTFEKKRLLIT